MSSENEISIQNLCRICAVTAENDVLHPLIENNRLTELGETFVSCLGLQLLKEGYPERICNYCQLQLNMFNEFVKKAKNSGRTFDSILGILNPEQIELNVIENNYILNSQGEVYEIKSIEDGSEGAVKLDDIDDLQNEITEEGIEISEELLDNESEYSVEYLEPEYMSTFEKEIDKKLREKENDKDNDEQKPAQRRTFPFRCKKCKKRFSYKEVYEAHMRIHKGLPGFQCPHCPKTFNEKSNFDYHMQDHTNYRPAKCELCEKSFKNKQDLASHYRCHNDIRKYMCDVCGKRFRSQSHMVYHRYSHFEERNFHCDKCTQSFKSPHVLRTHKNTVHSNVYRYACQECGRQFKRDHHLVAHKRVHLRAGKRKSTRKTTEDNAPEIKEETEFILTD